jgi:magnesium transporter
VNGSLPAAVTNPDPRGFNGQGGFGAWVLRSDDGECVPLTDPDEALALLQEEGGPVTWVHADLDDEDFLEALSRFGLPDLAVKSLRGGPERPRIEEYQNCLYVSIFYAEEGQDVPLLEELRVLLGRNWIVSLGTITREHHDLLVERIRRHVFDLGRGASHCLYYLVEWSVESLNPYLDALDDRVDGLEDQVVRAPRDNTREELFRLKRELVELRRGIAPLRDVMQRLSSHGVAFVDEAVGPYFRDVHDDVLYDIELLDTHRDLLTSALDLYLSTVSNRLGAVMKQLAIVATIFMPLTFITGFFGMNFVHLPFASRLWFGLMLFTIVASVAGMLTYFRRKSWL